MELDERDVISDTSGGVPGDLVGATCAIPSPLPPRQIPEVPSSCGSISSTAPSSSAITSASTSSTTFASSTPAVLSATLEGTTQPTTTLPWPATSFVPESGPYLDLFSRHDIPAAVYQAAGDGGVLELQAESLDSLAAAYVELRRFFPRFNIVNPDGTLRSFGHGIENECIFTTLNLFLNSLGQWGVVTDEDCLSLATSMPLWLASSVSAECHLEFSAGSHVAWPATAVGHRGNLSPFQGAIIGNLGIQMAALALRDESQHNALVLQAIHTGILGLKLHSHLETDYFASGIDLPCSNSFSFSKLGCSYPGGTEFYLAQAWTSFISDAAALEPYLIVSASALPKLAPHFSSTASDLDPRALFTGFLQ
ncbi:hypothetical protein K438DRAFT_1765187 [Mycena galopus ATCC 62051]|nr:hypothetical protein K438DRAFT_1765187 [Mycena galopus ATCC 62051]